MRVRILRQAMLEASAASDWYAARDAKVAEDFRIALDETVDQVAALPGVGSPWPGEPGVRRAHLRGFPYWVVYEEGAEAVTILAVAHEKRRPTYWREP
jgi:plasmid stabilization system protein ParE